MRTVHAALVIIAS